MASKYIITVGREFCSGGAQAAKKVADLLGINYYDKEIIDHTAALSRLSHEVVEKHDEKPLSYWNMIGYQYDTSWYGDDPSLLLPLGMRVADAQFRFIRETADKAPAVFVGRCADYALRNHKNVLHVFIRADLDHRIERAKALYDLTDSQAKKLVAKMDRIRASYYKNYTQQVWGDPKNHHLVLDAGTLGTDLAARIIVDCVKALEQKA